MFPRPPCPPAHAERNVGQHHSPAPLHSCLGLPSSIPAAPSFLHLQLLSSRHRIRKWCPCCGYSPVPTPWDRKHCSRILCRAEKELCCSTGPNLAEGRLFHNQSCIFPETPALNCLLGVYVMRLGGGQVQSRDVQWSNSSEFTKNKLSLGISLDYVGPIMYSALWVSMNELLKCQKLQVNLAPNLSLL